MASTSEVHINFISSLKHFPPVINGRINAMEFLDAATDLLKIVERLGTVFAPVKYDMQGNIDKVKKMYKYDESSCILELMQNESNNRGKPTAAEGILWLNRALLFFELSFAEIILNLQNNNFDVNLKQVFTNAYEGSVKKYHNWVTQQIFSLICRMCPSFTQMLESLEADKNIKEFGNILEELNVTLHLVRCKIDDFFYREHF